MSSTRPDPRPQLSVVRIVATALELIDRDGLAQFSIRRLGEALDVQGMAVYRYVAGKDDILDGVRRLLVEEFGARMDDAGPFGDWREHMDAFARCYRAVGRAHPDAFQLLATGAEQAWWHGRTVAGAALTRLLDAGFDEQTAIGAERTVIRYVIGFGLIDAANAGDGEPTLPDVDDLDASHPAVGRLMRTLSPRGTDERLFELGLELILDGLATRLPPAARPRGRPAS